MRRISNLYTLFLGSLHQEKGALILMKTSEQPDEMQARYHC